MGKNKRKNKKTIKNVAEGVKIDNNSSKKLEQDVQMDEKKEFFVKESLINELKKDSFEKFQEDIKGLAYEKLADIVGENVKTNLNFLATFKEHAIVADDFSNVYRLCFEQSEDGLRLSKSEKIESIKRYTKEDIEKNVTGNLVSSLSEKDSDKLKENFERYMEFKTSSKAENYINLKV